MPDAAKGDDPAGAPGRFRPRRAEPWHIGSILPWGLVATLGEPLLLALPLAATLAATIAILGAGVPATPETVVPVFALPPFGAYQDAGAVGLATSVVPLTWLGRGAFLICRAAVFGAVAHVALQRARDAEPRLASALSAVRTRMPALLVLELISASVFAIPLVLGQGDVLAPGRPVSQLGLLIGQILLINAYLAALDQPGVWRALRTGLRWVAVRPLGHLATAATATAASNGVYWLARAGEVGPPRALPLALYACVHAMVAAVFLAAFARRFRLLYAR